MKKSEYQEKLNREQKPYLCWLTEHESGLRKPELGIDGNRELIQTEFKQMGYLLFAQEPGMIDSLILMVVKPTIRKYHPDLIYTDEDEICANEAGGANSERRNPWFKPDWSPDTLDSFFYFGGLLLVREEAFQTFLLKEAVECPTQLCEENYDLFARFAIWASETNQNKISHIREMLYHVKVPRSYVYTKNISLFSNLPCNLDKISVVILSKDHEQMLLDCIHSIRKNEILPAAYELEIIVVDNGSSAKTRSSLQEHAARNEFIYLYHECDFIYSRLCNLGAKASSGEFLLFLNDDILQTEKNGFLDKMLKQAKCLHAGAVGCKLRYPEGDAIQHIGITNLLSGPSHKLATYSDLLSYDHGRNRFTFDVLAVTGACMMVEKKKFLEVGGFDEGLSIAYTDVDLCLDLLEKGYYNASMNHFFLLHFESVSRGSDVISKEKKERLDAERSFLYQKHPWLLEQGDPFYHPFLTKNRLDYSVDFMQDWEKEKPSGSYPALPKLMVDQGDRIHGQIDRCIVKEQKYIEIEGWAFCHRRNQLHYTPCIIIKNDRYTQAYEVTSKYRSDLPAVFPNEKNIALSGFVCRILMDEIPKKEPLTVFLGMTGSISKKCLIKETTCQIRNEMD